MCATCVAQGVVYVGGALAGLQVLGARARAKAGRQAGDSSNAARLPDAEAEAETAERQTAARR